jgi:hypothetical protein
MTAPLGNKPAYPRPLVAADRERQTCVDEGTPGASLREVYAGMAMQGLLANAGFLAAIDAVAAKRGITSGVAIARSAVEFADALLAELEKPR